MSLDIQKIRSDFPFFDKSDLAYLDNSATTQQSNNATKYYSIPAATFAVAGNSVIASTSGYIDAQTEVGAVTSGTLSTGMASKQSQGYTTLTDNSVVIPTDEEMVIAKDTMNLVTNK